MPRSWQDCNSLPDAVQIWNYCWFLIYAHEKHHEDKGLTSAEFFLERAWNHRHFHRIMPINRAMCMENRAR